MCETSEIAFVAICVGLSYKMPGVQMHQIITLHSSNECVSRCRWLMGYSFEKCVQRLLELFS